MKLHSLFCTFLTVLVSILYSEVFAQTNTTGPGNWNSPAVWSTGAVPGNGTITNVNHPLTLDVNLSPSATYTINSPVTDPDGGTNYNLSVSGTLNVYANMKVGGNLEVYGNITIKNGDTLTIGYPGSTAISNVNTGGSITIEAGGVLLVNGDLNTQFLGVINCDGQIIVDGNFDAGFLSGVAGSGTISTTGTMTTGLLGSVYGSSGDCNTGPCSGSSGCGVNSGNSISLGFSLPACSGVTPGTINGSNLSGSSYQWQTSTTSATSGFTNIASATGQNYTPAALTTTAWFRRVSSGGCGGNSTSSAVQVTVTTPSPVSISITSTTTAICAGLTSVTFTAIPVNGGTSPSYQWKKNGTNVGTNSATYTTTALAVGNTITCVLTSNASCISGNPATSNTITLTSLTNPVSVSITSTATSFCSGASITFTAAPLNGGGSPSYQWKKNGVNIGGATSSTYTTSTLANNNVITCILTSNASCITGNPATSSGITVSVLSSGGGTWSGGTSSNWQTNSNWCSGARPVAATNVIISSGVLNDPVVSSNAAVCNNLTLNSDARLTVNGNTLTLNGNLIINSGANLTISSSTLTVNGNITVNAGGTLTISSPGALALKGHVSNDGSISGSGTMTLNGTVSQNISGAGTFGNVTFANSNVAGVIVTSPVTISGILTLTSGILNSVSSNLTIDLNTGAIDGSGSGSISGNITTTKNISSNKYHMIACPLSGLTANDWNDDVRIQSGTYSNLYSYDETSTDTSKSVGWTAQTSLAAPLTSLKGFALYFTGATTIDQTGTYTHNASYSTATLTNTVSTVGASHNAASDGWNLVGNPYPSALDWLSGSGWTKTGLDNAIYFWDPLNSRYASYVLGAGTNGGTQYIPSMQAFWVYVTVPGTGTLGLNNNVRVTSTNPSTLKTAAVSDILKLTASSGAYSDETIIRFREDALSKFDSELDAYKMDNEDNTPTLYTEDTKDQYSVNSLPFPSKDTSISVKLKAAFNGFYTFTSEGIASFSPEDSIIFEDRLLGIKQNLRTNPDYTCALIQGDTSSRFYINFRKGAVSAINLNPPLIPSMILTAEEENIEIKFIDEPSNKAFIGIYNTLGEQVFKIENADISSKKYSVKTSNINEGIYIVKVTTDSQTASRKIYLRR